MQLVVCGRGYGNLFLCVVGGTGPLHLPIMERHSCIGISVR